MKALLAMLILWTAMPVLGADLNAAAQALESGDHATAVSLYDEAANDGAVNGHLFYNLGIALVRDGDLGRAVAAFLAARRFLPRDPDVAANLDFTLSKISDKLEAELPRDRVQALEGLLGRVTARELALTLAVLVGAIGWLMAVSFKVPALAQWRKGILAALVAPLAVGALLTTKLTRYEVWGAVDVEAKAGVYSGPSDQSTLVFELHEGAPVLVTARGTSGFLKIKLSDSKVGWIAGSHVKVYGPQFGAL